MNRVLRIHRIRLFLLSLLVLAACVLTFLDGEAMERGIQTGLLMCGNIIIPALFPFMVIILFIGKTGISVTAGRIFAPVVRWLFNLPAAAAVTILMSFAGGYPMGAVGAAELQKSRLINEEQAARMAYFCIGAGPAFILSGVGTVMFRSARAGFILLAAHIGAGLVIGIGTGIASRRRHGPVRGSAGAAGIPSAGAADSFVQATHGACMTLFMVCGFAVLFSGLDAALQSAPLSGGLKLWLSGLLEVTGGCLHASEAGNLPLAAFFLGFGGLSVICQLRAAGGQIRINLGVFLLLRLLHGGLSYGAVWIYLALDPVAVPVVSNGVRPVLQLYSVSLPASAALIFLAAVTVGAIRRRTAEAEG